MTPFTVGFLDHTIAPYHARVKLLRIPTTRLEGYFLAEDKEHFEMCIKRDFPECIEIVSHKCLRPTVLPAELMIFQIAENSSYAWYEVQVRLADYFMLADTKIWVEG